MTRTSALLVLLALVSPAAAQPVNLTEKVAAGDRARFTLELELQRQPARRPGRHEATRSPRGIGAARLRRAACSRWGRGSPLPRRGFTPRRGQRPSSRARSTSAPWRTIAGSSSLRRGADGLVCFAPAGPLTRDELDLVTEHFNPQCLSRTSAGEGRVGERYLGALR